MSRPLEPKIVARDSLPGLREREPGKAFVLATGCFDLLHKGHVFFLREAARYGDVLIVGVNSDDSVRELKGANRPIVPAADRCAVLAEFECVDYVFEYPERCAGVSIDLLRPDVFCVGEDSLGKYPDELSAAQRHGTRIERISKLQSLSTTEMIGRIQKPPQQRVRPLVSVIYVNWNTRRLLHDSLESLKKNTGGFPLEIVVVDNGSNDGTVAWLHETHPDVVLVPLDRNFGFAVGNNKGAERATGDYLLLLNTDTLVLASTVSGLVDVLEADLRVGCAGARHLNKDGSLQRSMDSFPNLEADILTYSELHRLSPVKRILSRRHAWWSGHQQQREVDWVNGACMMFRREAFVQAGGFDADFVIYGEEVDLCRRLKNKGWHVVFTPHAEVVHLGGASMDHIPGERLILKYNGLLRFYDKHKSRGARLAIRVVLMGMLVARAGLLLLLSALPRHPSFVQRARDVITQMGHEIGTRETFRTWRRIAAALTHSKT
jgi:rfaE bifunctional protein nucleotidyltransferase chain/domain